MISSSVLPVSIPRPPSSPRVEVSEYSTEHRRQTLHRGPSHRLSQCEVRHYRRTDYLSQQSKAGTINQCPSMLPPDARNSPTIFRKTTPLTARLESSPSRLDRFHAFHGVTIFTRRRRGGGGGGGRKKSRRRDGSTRLKKNGGRETFRSPAIACRV